MLYVWMMLAASLAQPATQPAAADAPANQPAATQPADAQPSGATRIRVSHVADADLDGTTLAQNEPGDAQADPRARRSPRVNVTAPRSQPNGVEIVNDSVKEVADVSKLRNNVEIQTLDDGTLMMIGDKNDLAILEAFVKLMDDVDVFEKKIQIINLEHAQAKALAPQIKTFWNEYKASSTGKVRREDEITIIAEPRANVLMIAATASNLAELETIIIGMDGSSIDSETTPQVQNYPLEYINAAEAETILNEMLQELQKQRASEPLQITIKGIKRTNSLHITAADADLVTIKSWIAMIDVPPSPGSGGVVKLTIYPLLEAKAQDMTDILTDMLRTDTDAGKAMEEQIRMLQVMVKDADGPATSIADLNLEKPIKIYPDKGSNALIVATIEENIAPVGAIIKLLDTHASGAQMMVKIFPLEHADAENVTQRLRDMFDQGGRLAEQPGLDVSSRMPAGLPGEALAYNISLTADKRSNAVLVSGRPEQMLLIGQVVEALDVKDDASKFHPRILPLVHADVEAIRETLQKVADQWRDAADKAGGGIAAERERVEIIPDIRTNSLIIVAREDNYDRIADLAARLDGADADYLGQVRILDVENLAASDIADKIEQLWERRLEQRRRGNLPEDKPVIVADTRSNALIIAANNEDYAAIERLIKQLEQQPSRPMQDIRQVVVAHNSASQLADTIQKLFDERLKQSLADGQKALPSDGVYLDADPMTNMMLVVSSQANYDEIVRYVTKLDIKPIVDGVIKTYYISNHDVEKVSDLIQSLFDKGIYSPGGAREIPEQERKVAIVTDSRSSALIISTSPQNFHIIDRMIEDLDQAETPIVSADARFIPIHHADVVNVADTLDQLFEGMRNAISDDQRDQLELKIIPDVDNNRVLIAGPRFAMKRAEELIPQIDTITGGPTSEVMVYPLEFASASKLANVFTELFDKRAPDGNTKHTPITILPDEGSNSLIVIATKSDHEQVLEWKGKLDVKSSTSQMIRVFPLEIARAEAISSVLTDLLDAMKGESEEKFAVVPDSRTESLIVFASPSLMSNVEEIIQKVDNNKSTGTMEVRVIKLWNQKAEDLGEKLDQFFESAGSESGSDTRQLIIEFSHYNRKTGREMLHKLVHQDITITPEPITNSLLMLAPVAQADMMEQLIDMLDSVEPVSVQLEVFILQNADASEMQDLLEGLFESSGSGKEGAPRILFDSQGGPTVAGSVGGESGTEIAFGVDTRTNSLIAAGSESHLKIVRELVTRLDYMEMDERKPQIVRLNYAKADEVAETISDFYKEEADLKEQAEDGTSAARLSQRQVTASAFRQNEDGESSVLLVSYSPRMESEVINLINELDQPPPQVMIEVLMAEVTLDDRFELGMEFAQQDLLFSETATTGPNGTIQGNNFDFIGGTSVGATGESALGGFSFTITGEDFNFLLRALQSEGQLEVLSRPSILVEDGKEATFKVGEQVPTVTDFTQDTQGNVIPSVNYQDVGVILEVTPIINPDGYVSMYVRPEISAIASSSVAVAAGVNLPIFTKREAETEVTIKDGETIIIGGLITSRTNFTESKVPMAGDVPILGNLFRANVKSNTKTELLIIITPHVIRTAKDARTHSIQTRDETGLMDKIRESSLMQKLRVDPSDEHIQSINDSDLRPMNDSSDLNLDTESEPLGPQLDEMGPEASSINVGGGEDNSIVFRRSK